MVLDGSAPMQAVSEYGSMRARCTTLCARVPHADLKPVRVGHGSEGLAKRSLSRDVAHGLCAPLLVTMAVLAGVTDGAPH